MRLALVALLLAGCSGGRLCLPKRECRVRDHALYYQGFLDGAKAASGVRR